MRLGPVVLALVLAPAAAAGADQAELRVLYAGQPEGARAKDFTAFLERHFSRVTVVDLGKFREADATGHDVVVFDWPTGYRKEADGSMRLDALPPAAKLSREFDRPALLVGAAGGKAVEGLGLKIDWLCLCLGDAAHGVADTHAVFREPHKVDLAYEELPTPDHYRRWPGGEKLGRTMKGWLVQTKRPPEVGPGLVSDPYGFADSPDAEVIAAGLNDKGPGSVALGRHGNFFLWGFSAAPADLTPAARTCFVNAVHYIRRFDGQKPLVRKTARGREWAIANATYARHDRREETFRLLFPKDLYEQLGRDPGKYAAHYEENLEYLRPSGNHFVADEDVKRLSLSNRKIALLDRCVALVEEGEGEEMATARRVLRRYTGESFGTPREWRAWLDKHRGRLFFSDAGGYRFAVGP